MKRTRVAYFAALLAISSLLIWSGAGRGLWNWVQPTAYAVTFTVTNTGDNGGSNPPVGAGTGTLRQAIVDANAAGGSNTIVFSIPGREGER